MKFLSKAKDGGPESKVTGYWLVELKSLFSIVLLRFDHGSRDAYHTHAFNAISWVLKGHLIEWDCENKGFEQHYLPSLWPIWTPRKRNHKVYGKAPVTWVLSIRGPWSNTWNEVIKGNTITLTHGRNIVNDKQ